MRSDLRNCAAVERADARCAWTPFVPYGEKSGELRAVLPGSAAACVGKPGVLCISMTASWLQGWNRNGALGLVGAPGVLCISLTATLPQEWLDLNGALDDLEATEGTCTLRCL